MAKSSAPHWTLAQLRAVRPELAASIERSGAAAPAGASKWSAAKPTARAWPGSGEIVTFPSKTEALVFDRLSAEVAATPGARLYRQIPLALLSIDGNRRGVPFKLTVDFAVVAPCEPVRYVEAKTKRKSRDWSRGAAAARASGFRIEEVER